jgi:hypothetical protein
VVVRILERGGDRLVIQPSYGGKATLRWKEDDPVEPVTAAQWRAEKLRQLDEGEAAAAGAGGEERARRLYLLAILAKTSGIPQRGAKLLARACAEDGFEDVLATFFPERATSLTKLWRVLEGKTAVAPSDALPPPPPVEPPALAPVRLPQPLPDSPAELASLAAGLIAEGRASMKRSLPGLERAVEHRKHAREALEAARTVLDRQLEVDPADAPAARRRREVQSMIETCVKDLGFFD